MSFWHVLLIGIVIYFLFSWFDEEETLEIILYFLIGILILLSFIDLFLGGPIFGDTNGLLYFE